MSGNTFNTSSNPPTTRKDTSIVRRGVSAAATIVKEDSYVGITAVGSNYTLTIPAGDVAGSGRILRFKDESGQASANPKVTIAVTGGGTIDGAANYFIDLARRGVTLISDGTNWHILSEYVPPPP